MQGSHLTEGLRLRDTKYIFFSLQMFKVLILKFPAINVEKNKCLNKDINDLFKLLSMAAVVILQLFAREYIKEIYKHKNKSAYIQ